jgi:hypothetical protein
MTTPRDLPTLRRAAGRVAADLQAATGDGWAIAVGDDFVLTATRDGKTVSEALAADLDEDDWEWDDLDAEILPTTLWHDATEAVWDVVDGGFFCWAAGIPACPRPGGGPLLLASGKWTCRTHAHDVAAVGDLAAALRG